MSEISDDAVRGLAEEILKGGGWWTDDPKDMDLSLAYLEPYAHRILMFAEQVKSDDHQILMWQKYLDEARAQNAELRDRLKQAVEAMRWSVSPGEGGKLQAAAIAAAESVLEKGIIYLTSPGE